MISMFSGAINVGLYIKRYDSDDDWVELVEDGTIDMVYGVPYLIKAVINKSNSNDTSTYSIDIGDGIWGSAIDKKTSIDDESTFYFPFGNYKYVETPKVYNANLYIKATKDDGNQITYDSYFLTYKINSIPLQSYSNVDALNYLSSKNIKLGEDCSTSAYNDFSVLYGCASNHNYIETKMYMAGHQSNLGLPIRIFTDCLPLVVVDSIILGEDIFVKGADDTTFTNISNYESCDTPSADYYYNKHNIKFIDENGNIVIDYTSPEDSYTYRTISIPSSLVGSGVKNLYIEYTKFRCSSSGDCVKQYTVKTNKPVMFNFVNSFNDVPNVAEIFIIYDNISREELMLSYVEKDSNDNIVNTEIFIPDVSKRDFAVRGYTVYMNVVSSNGEYIYTESDELQRQYDNTALYDLKSYTTYAIGGEGLYVVNYFIGNDGASPKIYGFLAQELKIPFVLEILLRDENGNEIKLEYLTNEYTPYCQEKFKSFSVNKQYDLLFKVKRNDSNIRNKVLSHSITYLDPTTNEPESVEGQSANIPVQDSTITRQITIGENTFCLTASVQLQVEYGLTL